METYPVTSERVILTDPAHNTGTHSTLILMSLRTTAHWQSLTTTLVVSGKYLGSRTRALQSTRMLMVVRPDKRTDQLQRQTHIKQTDTRTQHGNPVICSV